MSSTSAHSFLERHLGAIIAQFPPAVRDSLYAKFAAFYAAPHTAALEPVLRKRLTDDEVRHLLFAPTPPQFRHYAALLSIDGGGPHAALRRRFLTLFYLKHARHWPLVVEFILHDGLPLLTGLFLDDDPQTRGQAIDSFVQITSASAFDWFDPPRGYEARVLHAKMLALAAPTAAGIVPQIVASVRLYELEEEADKRLPGGSFVLLQVLAFFLSWVRKRFTQNELRLSTELLALLRDWQRRTRSENADEVALATQVYEDFSRWPAIDEGGSHLAVDAEQGAACFSPRAVDRLLATDGGEEKAIALCTEAISAGTHVVAATLARAKAYASLRTAEAASLCLDDCRAVLAKEPGSTEAWRLRLGVLERQQRWVDGRDALEDLDESQWLPEDAAFFTAQRELFALKAADVEEHLRVQDEQHAAKRAKQQRVFELLMQRSSSTSQSVSGEGPSVTSAKLQPPPQPPAKEDGDADVLARFRSNGQQTKQKKPSQKRNSSSKRKTAILRQFTQCKQDPAAVRAMLLGLSYDEAAEAMQSVLPEASLALVLEALAVEEHVGQTRPLLRWLLGLPRFTLMRELATEEEQRAIDELVGKTQRLLTGETAFAA